MNYIEIKNYLAIIDYALFLLKNYQKRIYCKLMCNDLLSFELSVFDLHLIYLKNGFCFVLILNNFNGEL